MYHEFDVPSLASYKFQFVLCGAIGTVIYETYRFVRLTGHETNTPPDLSHLHEVAEILLEAQESIDSYELIMENRKGVWITHTFSTINCQKGHIIALPAAT
jgi:hypothetical protein